MRLVSWSTLRDLPGLPEAVRAELRAWRAVVEGARWDSSMSVRRHFPDVDFVGRNAVFNVAHNRYRLVVRFDFRHHVVAVLWFGTHARYERLNVRELDRRLL